MWRLFIALELPQEVLQALEILQRQLCEAVPKSAARWVRPEGIHVTLKFLGEVPAEQVDVLVETLHRIASKYIPFQLCAKGLGCFPNTQRPRLLWVGVEGDIAALRELHRQVEQEISSLGFEPDSKKFTAHLTLARVARHATRDEQAALGELAQRDDIDLLASWRVDAISLMRSHLKPDGAVYTYVAVVPLTHGSVQSE